MKSEDKLFCSLRERYNITITKKELAEILSSSVSFIDKCIMNGKNIPDFKKLGESKNAKVIFNLVDVAKFLAKTTKVYHS